MESQMAGREMFPSVPQAGPTSIPQGSMAIPVQPYQRKSYLEKFLKGEPKALGTVQIMISLITLGLGAIISFTPKSPYGFNFFIYYTGYTFWGSAFFIVSGSLSIAAENRITHSLVLSSMTMNIISSVVAGLGIIFFSINMGSNIFLLILTILEFIISIVLSGFGCKAVCCIQSGVTIFMTPHAYGLVNSAAEASKGGTIFHNPDANIVAMP